jgi:hypothetical protein
MKMAAARARAQRRGVCSGGDIITLQPPKSDLEATRFSSDKPEISTY